MEGQQVLQKDLANLGFGFRKPQRGPVLFPLLSEPHPVPSEHPFLVLVYPEEGTDICFLFSTQQPFWYLTLAILFSLSLLFSLNHLTFSRSPQGYVASGPYTIPGTFSGCRLKCAAPGVPFLFSIHFSPPALIALPTLPCCRQKSHSYNLRFGGRGFLLLEGLNILNERIVVSIKIQVNVERNTAAWAGGRPALTRLMGCSLTWLDALFKAVGWGRRALLRDHVARNSAHGWRMCVAPWAACWARSVSHSLHVPYATPLFHCFCVSVTLPEQPPSARWSS